MTRSIVCVEHIPSFWTGSKAAKALIIVLLLCLVSNSNGKHLSAHQITTRHVPSRCRGGGHRSGCQQHRELIFGPDWAQLECCQSDAGGGTHGDRVPPGGPEARPWACVGAPNPARNRAVCCTSVSCVETQTAHSCCVDQSNRAVGAVVDYEERDGEHGESMCWCMEWDCLLPGGLIWQWLELPLLPIFTL